MDTLMIFGTILIVGGIPLLIGAAMHPALGVFVLVAGLALGFALSGGLGRR